MVTKKRTRTKGKLSLSKYFQNLEKGDFVAVIRELSLASNFPKRLQGRTGTIDGRRGGTYIVKIRDQDKEKKFLIEPIHLKKLKINK